MRTLPEDIVAVDIGNSTVKLYKAENDDSSEMGCVRFNTFEEAFRMLDSLAGYRVAYLSTRELTEKEKRLVEEKGWWEFTSRTQVPMEVLYDRSTLGPDRLAVAVACSEEFSLGGCLIVDAGSALTLDLISSEGGYLGGNISPGMRMRFRALHDFTSRLPLVESGTVKQRFGHDTRNAILSGVVKGMVGEIACTFLDAEKSYGVKNIAFTGGDAVWFANAATDKIHELNLTPDRMIYEDGLVGKGLIEAYIYNHE